MIENLVIQMIFKLVLAVAAIATARTAISYLDKISGSSFTHWLHKADDLSRAIYYAGRIIAVCLLVGFCIQ